LAEDHLVLLKSGDVEGNSFSVCTDPQVEELGCLAIATGPIGHPCVPHPIFLYVLQRKVHLGRHFRGEEVRGRATIK
jgi:hypothetical protein